MTTTKKFTRLEPLQARLETLEHTLTRPTNTLTFLVIRFLLMSGMVVGFSWWSLQLSP